MYHPFLFPCVFNLIKRQGKALKKGVVRNGIFCRNVFNLIKKEEKKAKGNVF